jgi:1,4-alpha-glucan branching enzyme
MGSGLFSSSPYEGQHWNLDGFFKTGEEYQEGGTMIRKNHLKGGKVSRATFDLPPEIEAESVSLCGGFNQWSYTDHPMIRRKDGRFSITVSLEAGKTYRFRYLIDGRTWENDWEADGHAANDFGTEDSLVKL